MTIDGAMDIFEKYLTAFFNPAALVVAITCPPSRAEEIRGDFLGVGLDAAIKSLADLEI